MFVCFQLLPSLGRPAEADPKKSKRVRNRRVRRLRRLYRVSVSLLRCLLVFERCLQQASRQLRVKKSQSGFANGASADYDDYIEFRFHRCGVCSFSNAVFNRRAGSRESKKAEAGSQTARPPPMTIISNSGFLIDLFVFGR